LRAHLVFADRLRLFFLCAWLVMPVLVFGQTDTGVNIALKLQPNLLLGAKVFPAFTKKVDDGRVMKLEVWDGYFTECEITDSIFFNRVKAEYNSSMELTALTYYCDSKEKTEKNKERFISTLEKYYGKSTHPDKTFWGFQKGDDHASFYLTDKGCDMSLWTERLIKAVKEFGQYEKATVIAAQGFINNGFEGYVGDENTAERNFWFKGIVQNSTIEMHYTMIPYKIKLLKVRLNDTIISIKPVTRYFAYRQYHYIFNISREIANKFYRSSKMTLITMGKKTDEVEVPSHILKMYRVIYEEMYK